MNRKSCRILQHLKRGGRHHVTVRVGCTEGGRLTKDRPRHYPLVKLQGYTVQA